jgi:hypothetical protein
MPPTHSNQVDRIESVDAESFSFLNELALVFRSGEKHVRPQYAPVLEGIRTVLAHLASTGRLIPAGGMALTAEQVEDVRTVVFTKSGSDTYLLAGETVDRLRALFPATEPAEERCPTCNDSGDVHRMDGEWLGVCDCPAGTPFPAPAEPAEEETKAEACSGGGDMHPCVLAAGHAGVHTDSRGLRWNYPASSPVVPAPTETGPWDSIEEVPEGVTVRGTNPVAGLWRGGPYWKSVSPEHSAAVSSLAPFVAAEEG